MSIATPPPEILSRFPEVSWKRKDIEPFGALYLRAEDTFIWRAFSTVAGIQLTLKGRILLPDGTINAINEVLTPTGDNLLTQKVSPLTEGWLIALEIIPTTASVGFGTVWTTVDLNRGTIAGVESVGLISGYVVTSARLAAWPYLQVGGAAQFNGGVVENAPANPAAGAEIILTTGNNSKRVVQSFSAILTTGVAVPVRTVHIVVDDGAARYYENVALATQAASLAVRYVFAAGVPALTTTDGVQVIPLPPRLFLFSGNRIRTLTTGLAAADQWSVPVFISENWFDVNT